MRHAAPMNLLQTRARITQLDTVCETEPIKKFIWKTFHTIELQ